MGWEEGTEASPLYPVCRDQGEPLWIYTGGLCARPGWAPLVYTGGLCAVARESPSGSLLGVLLCQGDVSGKPSVLWRMATTAHSSGPLTGLQGAGKGL